MFDYVCEYSVLYYVLLACSRLNHVNGEDIIALNLNSN